MLLWVLCVKLWWLLLVPLGGYGLPSESGILVKTGVRSLNTRRSVQEAAPAAIEKPQQEDPWQTENLTNIVPGVAKSTTPLTPQDALSATTYTGPAIFVGEIAHGDEWSFHWSFGEIIEIEGTVNLKTTETDIYVEVFRYSVGDFSGNLDDGITFDINVLVAQGTASIYIKERKTKKENVDEVWLHLALKLPLRRHFNRDFHMFDLPHSPDIKEVAVM